MARNWKSWWIGCSVLASLAWTGVGRADAPDGRSDGPPRGPPPEAIQACNGLQAGASCSVTFGDGAQMSGTCRAGPQGEAAACAPNGHPGRFHPPPEAIQACSSLQDGVACSFTAPDGAELSGTCRTAPDGSGMACAPNHLRR